LFATNAQNTSWTVGFENGAVNQNVQYSGWQNIATEGSRLFVYDKYQGNKYAKATAYGNTNNDPTNVIWLITPAINATNVTKLSFYTAYGYYKHDPAFVGVSTNFVSDPAAATWTELTYNKPQNPSSSGYTILKPDGYSGEISLANYANQTIYVGFKYTGSKPNGQTTTWQIDSITVSGILGFDLNLTSNKISVYPNPATDYITISSFERGKVEIYNAIGVKVLESDEATINVKDLKAGLYFVTMENEGQKYVAKFLKN